MVTSLQKQSWVQILRFLKSKDYSFATVTPSTHRMVIDRRKKKETTLNSKDSNDILNSLLGWSEWVQAEEVEPELLRLLKISNSLEEKIENGSQMLKSKWRVSHLGGLLFVHSAYPTNKEDSVFFGPDSYRFVRFLKQEIHSAGSIADICAGSGVGAISLADHLKKKGQRVERVVHTDLNALALDTARINSEFAEIKNSEFVLTSLLEKLPRGIDTLISNPPFISGSTGRMYSSGGGDYGTAISKQIVESALDYLEIDGRLALYTGAAIIKTKDTFLNWIDGLSANGRFQYAYDEIDPDIFGNLLSGEGYGEVDRIAAVGVVITKK